MSDDSNVPSPDWWSAMDTLNGNGLAICRVTKTASGFVTIVWRNPPSSADQAKATNLIGPVNAHSW